ncbi:hypothetical protein FHT44_005014 [Mycolicibacterium sp. BK634]|uniref:SLOG family protein n=1 Tax=Mycolicibacterium sp. BK634 TaxID=2587099 RepID=UPI00160C4FF2|nr:hypothetical protein [Mycolicibacterium sp. BK634]
MTHIHDYTEWIEEPGHDSRTLEWVRVCECGFSPDRLAHRVIVTGSRVWKDPLPIIDALWDQFAYAKSHDLPMVVVEGRCPHGGADKIAENWAKAAKRQGLPVDHDPIPANWEALGKRAGPFRNQVMADRGGNACLAFPLPESRGTWDMIRRALDAGIPVGIFENGEMTWHPSNSATD